MTVWYPCNIATKSYYVRELLEEYAEKTQDTPFVAYQYHNFGARGSANPEAASLGGVAHLIADFFGSDNFSAMKEAVRFYGPNLEGMSEEEAIKALMEFKARIMHSINATEHSSTTAWTRENEIAMIMNHLEKNKGRAIIAAVMDSYDYFKAVRIVCKKDGEFQTKINSDEYPIFVMRPDSGNPAEIIPETLDIMEEEEIPYTVNKKGYKVFNKMRIIWGDGINMEAMRTMLEILEARGYSSENIAFGSGGWLMQQHDRDTQGWAVKCSEITLDEGSPIDTGELKSVDNPDAVEAVWEPFYVTRDVYKDPITAPGKKSKKGKMTLWYNTKTKEYFTGPLNMVVDGDTIDAMSTIFENGRMIKTYTLDEARANSRKG
jgi:nicotinamide phosphoribosyltransferase